jgi:hypothetical protein
MGTTMKLKSFKTIQVLYVVVSASALMVACNSKTTAPLGLMSSTSNANFNEETKAAKDASLIENYGVSRAQSVIFTKDSDEQVKDYAY